MIEKLLKRYKGSYSYEEGVKILKMASISSNGSNYEALSFQKKDVVLPTQAPVPILATLKNTKQQIPYENEFPFDFQVRYINQNDEEHIGVCHIPVYAEENTDFRIVMQEKDDFVKEIIGAEPREDVITFGLNNLVNIEQAVNIMKLPLEADNIGWNSEEGYMQNGSVSLDGGKLKLSFDSVGNTSFDMVTAIPLFDFVFSIPSEYVLYEDIIRYFGKCSPLGFMDLEKNGITKLKVKFDSEYQLINVLMLGKESTYITKIITSNTTVYNSYLSAGYPVELISVGVWTEITIQPSEYLFSGNTSGGNEFNKFGFVIGLIGCPDATYNYWFDYMKQSFRTGNINDSVEIIGLSGNIAKLHGVDSILLSESLYNLRVASMQRFVKAAYRGGLKHLLTDFRISLGKNYSNEVRRLFLSLFSTFVVPAKSVMMESMNTIYSILDPAGFIEVTAEYSETYYKMIVNVYWSFPDFTSNDVDILLLFIERYRPVPAIAETNIVHANNELDEKTIEDSGEVDIYFNPTVMSSFTIMSPSLIMGLGSHSVQNLPADYP